MRPTSGRSGCRRSSTRARGASSPRVAKAGTAGIYRPSGELRTGLVDEIEHSVPFESLIWEAPTKESQAWFIKHFGTNVNLGNIPPDEVIPLETLRLGLRGDTLKEVLLGGEPATTG